MNRDYELAARVSTLGDDALVGPREIAAIADLSPVTVQQRKVRGFPDPLETVRHLRWRLGDVRQWMRGSSAQTVEGTLPRRPGRPTKAEQVAAGRA